MAYSETIDDLNLLLTRNYDAEKGFRKAAIKVDQPWLSDFFKGSSVQHNQFGHQLSDEIRKLNGKPDKYPSLEGNVHRAWMNIKELLSARDSMAMLQECDRGQKMALEAYERILEESALTPSSRKIVQQQRETITENIRHIEKMIFNLN